MVIELIIELIIIKHTNLFEFLKELALFFGEKGCILKGKKSQTLQGALHMSKKKAPETCKFASQNGIICQKTR